MIDPLDELNRRIRADELETLGKHVGADAKTTKRAVEQALPMLVQAMGRNARHANGAKALAAALERDHDGSILENIQSHLQQPEQANGHGILKHVLGSKRGALESLLGKKTGLSAGAIGSLLAALAPLLMGAVGKAKKDGGLQANDLGGVLKKAGGGLLSKAGCLMSLLPLLSKFIGRK